MSFYVPTSINNIFQLLSKSDIYSNIFIDSESKFVFFEQHAEEDSWESLGLQGNQTSQS